MAQEIIKGLRWNQAVKNIVKENHCGRCLVVCDSVFSEKELREMLREADREYFFFRDFTPNPLYEQMCRGIEIFREKDCDSIVALGGGSAIDTAKCIRLWCNMDQDKDYMEQEPRENHVLFIAIPTTAGTGSESTRYAAIYRHGEKQSVNSLQAIPDYAVLDHHLLETLPLYQKKCTMLDALCQGIESWWSVNSTEESRKLSEKALQMIRCYKQGFLDNTAQGNQGMLEAANLAGQAINLTQTTAPHAMSYKLTSLYGIPHGRAAAACLPFVWTFMLENPDRCTESRGKEYLQQTFQDIAQALGEKTPQDACLALVREMKQLFQDKPFPTPTPQELKVLGESVNPVRLKNNPVVPSEEEFVELYRKICECF